MNYTGSCQCGALQYSSSSSPVETGYCHCRICQKLSGAPLLPWASFETGAFNYTKGQPTVYQSSAYGQREFCAVCGSQIAFRDTEIGDTVEINVGTLDDPSQAIPTYHIWYDSRLPWFETKDDLPRHPRSVSTNYES
jgi:hypothetical protein